MGLLACYIKEAKHCVFITGAGISTNANIRDYRGPNGIWTEAAKQGKKEGDVVWDDAFYESIPSATPQLAHLGIRELVERGLCEHVISQNEDGLHLRSGLPRAVLSELHGNDFIEICKKCKCEVFRDFVTYYGDTYKKTNPLGAHVTGRRCPECDELNGEQGGMDWLPDLQSPHPSHSPGRGPWAQQLRLGPGPPAADWLLVAAVGLVDTCVDFGESPCGDPWGSNKVHNLTDALKVMATADLVVAWG